MLLSAGSLASDIQVELKSCQVRDPDHYVRIGQTRLLFYGTSLHML